MLASICALFFFLFLAWCSFNSTSPLSLQPSSTNGRRSPSDSLQLSRNPTREERTSFVRGDPSKLLSQFPRPFPWDVLRLILQFSDVSTLAAFGSVCYDLLAWTAPRIYSSIRVTSFSQLELLLCERKLKAKKKKGKSSRSKELDSLLSLSQIRTLTVDLQAAVVVPYSLLLSFSRIINSIPLDTIQIMLSSSNHLHVAATTLYALQKSLSHRLNPSRVDFRVVDRPFEDPSLFNFSFLAALDWRRVESVDFQGVVPTRLINNKPRFLFVPERPSNPLRLRFHVRTLFSSRCPTLDRLLDILLEFEAARLHPGSIVLVLASEIERSIFKKVVDQLEERWRAFIEIEMAA